MSDLTYAAAATGGWLALADAERMLAIAPDGVRIADEAWAAIRSERGFEAVIDLLMRGGFASMPDFVLLEWRGGSVRTLLRGPAVLEVTDAAGRHTQDGAGISTWTERTFSAATFIEVSIVGSEPAPGLTPLPLGSGAAVVAGATITVGDTAHEPSPLPATEAPRAPERVPAPDTAPEPDRSEVADHTAVPDQTIIPDTTATAPPAAAETEPDDSTVVRPRRAPAAHPSAAPTPAAPTPASSTRSASTSAASATRSPASGSPTPPPLITAPPAGDHDGETLLTSDVQKMRARRGAVSSPAPRERESAASVPVLTLADGSVEPLDQAVIVGRSPSLSKVSGQRMPRLISVGEGDHDISRNHAQFAVEGGTVVVTDLHSRNGTVVVLPGRSPQKLRAGEPTAVIAGTLVDLGGGVTFTVGEP